MLRLGVVVLACVVGTARAQTPPPAATEPPAKAPQGDLAALQGYWKPLSIVHSGVSQEKMADELRKLTGVFDQTEYHLYFKAPTKDPIRLARMTVTLDPTTTPKTVVFEFAAGPLKGQKRHGIYELAGNELKLCYGEADKPKPTTFTAPTGSGHYLEVWARQTK
jgi:uncharacterized protein (TIGR03067 family)